MRSEQAAPNLAKSADKIEGDIMAAGAMLKEVSSVKSLCRY
jgi:hypothetical protein